MSVITALETAMTTEEQHAFLDAVVSRNPHLEGGTVGDFLEMMSDTDSDLGAVESFPQPPGVDRMDVLGPCIRAVLHSHGHVDASRVLELYRLVLPAAPADPTAVLLEDVHFGPPTADKMEEDIADLGGV